MGIASATSGYTNIGNDLQITLVGGLAGTAIIPNVMALSWRQLVHDISVTQMNGIPLFASIPNGFEGTIEFHRQDGAFEAEMTAIQQSWLAGNAPTFRLLTCFVAGRDNKAFNFTTVTIKLEEGGEWRGDEVTRCRLGFRASLLQ